MESISVTHTEDYLSHSDMLERPGSRRRSGTFQLVRGRFTESLENQSALARHAGTEGNTAGGVNQQHVFGNTQGGE